MRTRSRRRAIIGTAVAALALAMAGCAPAAPPAPEVVAETDDARGPWTNGTGTFTDPYGPWERRYPPALR